MISPIRRHTQFVYLLAMAVAMAGWMWLIVQGVEWVAGY